MKKLLFLLLASSLSTVHSQSITRLLACSPFDDQMQVLDTSSYLSVYTRTLTAPGSVNGITGMSKQPSTGIYYTVVKTANSRWLGTLNPITGSLTIIGNLVDQFSQITFNGNSTLLGVTGAGATVPSTVYRINTTTAGKSFLKTLTNDYGQVICYNPTDNRIYHWSGGNPDYESYDTTFTAAPTNITLSTGGTEVVGAVHKMGNTFVSYDFNDEFKSTGANGTITSVTNYTSTGQDFKGLAYITCSRTITASASAICGGNPATLTMSGVPDATYQWYKDNVLLIGATAQTYTATTVGHYNCIITDGCGMDSLSAGVKLVSGTLPVVTITSTVAAVCAGQTVELLGSTGGTSQWYKNGILIAGANTNTYVANGPGLYNMIKTNTNGCKDSASVGKTITAVPNPTPVINLSPTICAMQATTITATGASSYTWNTGSNATALAVTPASTTSYTLTGEQNGCKASVFATQVVDPCTGIPKQITGSPFINVFPNPAKEMINIESEKGIRSVAITDLAGKILLEEKSLNGSACNINVRGLQSSLYFIRITHNDGTFSQVKISVE